jgi:hypothetical protein
VISAGSTKYLVRAGLEPLQTRPLPFRRKSVRGQLLALMLWLVIAPHLWATDHPKPTEYEVKAAYLLNFGKFVQWPSLAEQNGGAHSFFLCVLGRDPFGPVLDTTLAGETISGKNIISRHIATAQETEGCQVLFISASEEGRVNDILHSLSGTPVLTVSDLPRFTSQGGMIQFVMEQDRVRFEVNLMAAQQAGLSLSSQLLKVAVHVRNGSGER